MHLVIPSYLRVRGGSDRSQLFHIPTQCTAPIAAHEGIAAPTDGSQTQLLTSLVYHVDRMADPDTPTRPGTIENIRRNEEILVYVVILR